MADSDGDTTAQADRAVLDLVSGHGAVPGATFNYSVDQYGQLRVNVWRLDGDGKAPEYPETFLWELAPVYVAGIEPVSEET